MIKLAKLKSGTYKKIFISESICFEASNENTKTSNIIPDGQIDFIYDVRDGKVQRIKSLKPKRSAKTSVEED
jgi:hypothetical protein